MSQDETTSDRQPERSELDGETTTRFGITRLPALLGLLAAPVVAVIALVNASDKPSAANVPASILPLAPATAPSKPMVLEQPPAQTATIPPAALAAVQPLQPLQPAQPRQSLQPATAIASPLQPVEPAAAAPQQQPAPPATPAPISLQSERPATATLAPQPSPVAPAASMAVAPTAPRAPTTVGLWSFLRPPDIAAGATRPHGDRGTCSSCHRILPSPAATSAPVAAPTPVSASAPVAPVALAAAPSLPSTTSLPLQSVRWAGLEVVTMGPRVAGALGAPAGSGVILMSVDLHAVSHGLLAGDIVTAIDGKPTPDLSSFAAAAQSRLEPNRARVQLLRRGAVLSFDLNGDPAGLGQAVGRTAPAIAPTSTAPHAARGACASCHPISAALAVPARPQAAGGGF